MTANCGRMRTDTHPGLFPEGEGARDRCAGFLNGYWIVSHVEFIDTILEGKSWSFARAARQEARPRGIANGLLAPVATGFDAIALETADEGGVFG